MENVQKLKQTKSLIFVISFNCKLVILLEQVPRPLTTENWRVGTKTPGRSVDFGTNSDSVQIPAYLNMQILEEKALNIKVQVIQY